MVVSAADGFFEVIGRMIEFLAPVIERRQSKNLREKKRAERRERLEK
jgi:hypothetical protein